MEIKTPDKRGELFENTLPLINIVFLLLIFFMLAGTFSSPEYFQLNLPLADTGNAVNTRNITLLMDANGELAIADSPYTQTELIDYLQAQHLEQIQLKADGAVKAAQLLGLIEALAAINIQTIHLMTLPE